MTTDIFKMSKSERYVRDFIDYFYNNDYSWENIKSACEAWKINIDVSNYAKQLKFDEGLIWDNIL